MKHVVFWKLCLCCSDALGTLTHSTVENLKAQVFQWSKMRVMSLSCHRIMLLGFSNDPNGVCFRPSSPLPATSTGCCNIIAVFLLVAQRRFFWWEKVNDALLLNSGRWNNFFFFLFLHISIFWSQLICKPNLKKYLALLSIVISFINMNNWHLCVTICCNGCPHLLYLNNQ